MTTRITYREAVRAALHEALKSDPRVFLMGEDVGRYGGAFACSRGLLGEYGAERVRDAPLSESAFVGAGIGAAVNSLRPIVEVMTVNFSLLALDQVVNNAATIHHMSGGQISVPLVIRMTTGAGRQLAAQHSHSFEAWYAHIPGIKVLAPATVDDARYMLGAALHNQDPVVIFEHIMLYSSEGDVDESPADFDAWHARIRREGCAVTLVTYGGSLPKTLQAAEQLAAEGIAAEVVDLRSLRPLDMETVRASVVKTRRVLIIDEGWRTCGLAAEISAQLMETAFGQLDAPVARLCSAEVPMPYAEHLERAALPQVDSIVDAARRLVKCHD